MHFNVVNENGKPNLKFIGIGHVTDPGASGHLAALKLRSDDTVGFHESVCAVHSTANAYKDLFKNVPKIDHLVEKLAAISTYFHVSANRTSELEKVAKVEGLTVLCFPKYFEFRWAEFTAALLDAILCSWQALVKFNVEQCDAEGKKFPKFLTKKDNLLLMCFVADLLSLIKVFEKKLQSDSLTIVDIEPEAEKFYERVNKLSTGSLLGDRRKFSAIRTESVIAINTFVDKRLQVDRNASKSFTLFVKIMATEDEIKEGHRSIATDLDLANVPIQY
eukprot:gene15884-7217_t